MVGGAEVMCIMQRWDAGETEPMCIMLKWEGLKQYVNAEVYRRWEGLKQCIYA